MMAPLLPNEGSRLDALHRLGILDTPAEERFDRITRLAAQTLNCPVAMVSLVDANRQWFKSSYGTDIREIPRDISICAHTIAQDDLLVINDVSKDPRFVSNPLVVGPTQVRFYAGCTLHSADGMPLGSLCVIDFEPRELDARERNVLRELCALTREQLIIGQLADQAIALAESDQQLRNILGNMQDALIVADATGRILLSNPAVKRISGKTPAELEGENLQILMPEPYYSDAQGYDRYLHDLRARRFPHGEFARRGNGERIPIERRSSRLLGTGGRRFIHLIRDVSERDATRRLLLESEGRFREAFDNAPIGQALIALNGKYLQVNRSFCDMVGYTPDELRGKSARDITHKDDWAADIEQVRRIRAGEIRSINLEKRYFHKRGQIVWVHLTSTPVRGINGKALHYIAQMQDITARREADLTKSDFLATAAHELRSPLASIYGFSELLLQKKFNPTKQQELLTIIHSQSRHMTLLINELLDLARIESKAGRDFNITRQPLDVIVRSVINEYLLPPDREPVDLQIDAPLPDVCVDVDKTRQALTNVISNAFKYSPQGGPVTVRVALEPDGRHIAIRVRDQGIGIPPDSLARVWERFFRVGDSTVTGTGLGMTLVKEIIERQQGQVRIDSEYRKWTEVTLSLVVATSLSTASAALTTPAQPYA